MSKEGMSNFHLPHPNLVLGLSGDYIKTSSGYELVDGGGLWGVPDHRKWWGIVRHKLLVMRVGIAIAERLNMVHANDGAWEVIDVQLLAEALFNEDGYKRWEKQETHSLNDHGEWAEIFLRDINHPKQQQLRELVGIHLYGLPAHMDKKPEKWIEKIMMLADHHAADTILSLEERHENIRKRSSLNGGDGMRKLTEKILTTIIEAVVGFESELLSELSLDTQSLVTWLKSLPPFQGEAELRAFLKTSYKRKYLAFLEYQELYASAQTEF